jgi:hypothetical protein
MTLSCRCNIQTSQSLACELSHQAFIHIYNVINVDTKKATQIKNELTMHEQAPCNNQFGHDIWGVLKFSHALSHALRCTKLYCPQRFPWGKIYNFLNFQILAMAYCLVPSILHSQSFCKSDWEYTWVMTLHVLAHIFPTLGFFWHFLQWAVSNETNQLSASYNGACILHIFSLL